MNEEFNPHFTWDGGFLQEHPVIDVFSRINQGGQTSWWAIVCSVKLNTKISMKDDNFALMTL